MEKLVNICHLSVTFKVIILILSKGRDTHGKTQKNVCQILRKHKWKWLKSKQEKRKKQQEAVSKLLSSVATFREAHQLEIMTLVTFPYRKLTKKWNKVIVSNLNIVEDWHIFMLAKCNVDCVYIPILSMMI